MEKKAKQNQIVIKTFPENGKQKIPMNLILSLAAGTVAGVAVVFGVIWAVELIMAL